MPKPKKKLGLAGIATAGVDAEPEAPADNSYSSMLGKDIMYGQARINPDPFKRGTIDSNAGGGATLDMDINQPVMDPDQSLQAAVGPRTPIAEIPRMQGLKGLRMMKKIRPMKFKSL